MFNDLTPAGQNNSQPKNSSVDDIFADTDKTAENKNFSGYYANKGTTMPNSLADLETKKVGLSSLEETPRSSKGKILKVILIALMIILLIFLSYLVYDKFLNNKNAVDNNLEGAEIITVNPNQSAINIVASNTPVVETPVITTPSATPSSTIATTTSGTIILPIDSDNDNLSDDEELILGTNPNLADSDSDSLPDQDEARIYNTNPNLADSDSDGLSDYEEIKIYKTNPNKADSDGDSFNDKAEIDNGYNPLGDGKLDSSLKK